jgi:hypothetical protein
MHENWLYNTSILFIYKHSHQRRPTSNIKVSRCRRRRSSILRDRCRRQFQTKLEILTMCYAFTHYKMGRQLPSNKYPPYSIVSIFHKSLEVTTKRKPVQMLTSWIIQVTPCKALIAPWSGRREKSNAAERWRDCTAVHACGIHWEWEQFISRAFRLHYLVESVV